MQRKFLLKSRVIVYPGMGGWRFLALPTKEAKVIKETFGKYARGWRSLRVAVTVGKITWKTSIFPDKKSGTYLLPLKAQIRKAEGIGDGDTVKFTVELL